MKIKLTVKSLSDYRCLNCKDTGVITIGIISQTCFCQWGKNEKR